MMNNMTNINKSNNLLKENVITFFSGKKDFNSLSNFWTCKIVINDDNDELITRKYESGEHCFHGEKYYRLGCVCLDETRKNQLLQHSYLFLEGSCKSAAEIKRLGSKKGLILTNVEIELWTKMSIDVQRKICEYKYNTHEEVRNDIVKSGYKILVHPAMRCCVENIKTRMWEGRAVISEPGRVEIYGGNILGKIWMNIRWLNLEHEDC